MEGLADRTEEILARHLDADFWCAQSSRPPPSAAELIRFAAEHGCRFPDDYLVHATGKWHGIYVEVKEARWPRPKPFEVGPFWSFLYAVFVYGLDPEAPAWMNLKLATEQFQADAKHPLIPCLKVVGDANIYLFNSDGAIVRWDHETDEVEAFEGSFFDLLEREIGELRARKDRKLEEARAG